MRMLLLLAVLIAIPAFAADISGTWNFSVDLDGGGHGDPVLTLTQAGAKVTGTYNGPLGEHPVTGSVKGDTAVLEFKAEQQGDSFTVTYSAKLESADKMSGTVNFSNGGTGKWTATRKK